MVESNKQQEVLKQPYWKDPKPSYTMIGSGAANKMFPENTIDALAVIGSLNQSQLEIFLYFRDMLTIQYQLDKKYPNLGRNLNEVCLNIDDDYTKRIKSLMQKNNNVKTIVYKSLIKKGKRKCYMVNPFVLLPNRDFKRHAQLWKYYDFLDEQKGLTLETFLISLKN